MSYFAKDINEVIQAQIINLEEANEFTQVHKETMLSVLIDSALIAAVACGYNPGDVRATFDERVKEFQALDGKSIAEKLKTWIPFAS